MTPLPYTLSLLGIGLVVLLAVWLPLALRRLPLTLAIVFVGLGAAIFSLGWLEIRPDPRAYPTLTERLTELVLIIALMGAGLKLDRPLGWRRWETTWRLLGVAMPLTIAAVGVVAYYGLGFSLAMALLLGAALAPTDPVLASDIQVGSPGSGQGDEVRFALTSEAGLNDGLAFPFVQLAIALAAGAAVSVEAPAGISDLWRWLIIDLVWRTGAGVGVGWLVGRTLGWLTFGSERRLASTRDGLAALGATLVAYALTELAHGYGFLAVFVAGFTLRTRERDHQYHRALHEVAEQIERLLMVSLLVLFGGALTSGLLSSLTWRDFLVGLAVILVIRPVAGWLSMVGAPPKFGERRLIAFLGIRGIGSFYYVAYAVNHGAFGLSHQLWAITGLVVLLSILLHGITATPLLRRMDVRLSAKRGGEVRNSAPRYNPRPDEISRAVIVADGPRSAPQPSPAGPEVKGQH